MIKRLEWKEKAKEMYFIEKMKIKDIAHTVGKTRKTVSSFLSTQDGFLQEKERRKLENKEKRVEYKKNWEKVNRTGSQESEILQRQHDIDVRVLSAEKY